MSLFTNQKIRVGLSYFFSSLAIIWVPFAENVAPTLEIVTIIIFSKVCEVILCILYMYMCVYMYTYVETDFK